MTDTDETPREWWIWKEETSNRALLREPGEKHPSDLCGNPDPRVWSYHVIEHSAYLRVKEERDALTARVAELEAALALKAKAHIK